MSGWARRLVPVALCGVLLGAVSCGGDDSGGTAASSSAATSAPTTGAPTTSATAPSTSTGGNASSTTGSFGPAPLVPGSGQTWADLYPGGQPPVFPLPNSSRAFPAPEA